MLKKLFAALLLAAACLAPALRAHEGHHEAGAFEPPHGGAFAEFAGHWVELYAEGGKLLLCMYEMDGQPVEDRHAPKAIQLRLSGKGVKSQILKAGKTEKGCAGWAYALPKAKLLRAELSALVDGKKATAKLALELKK